MARLIHRLFPVGLVLFAAGFSACEKRPVEPPPTAIPDQTVRNRSQPNPANAQRTETKVWPVAQEILNQSVTAAEQLKSAIDQLLASPTIENLERAQSSWRNTANHVEQFHLFSRLAIAAPEQFNSLIDLQYNVSAWPIQPGYLDGFGEHPYSGIVFDVGVPITEAALREQHGFTDNSDAALGLYALEFLLFGEQNNRGPLLFMPITALNDKYIEDGFTQVEELPRNRRRELMRLQAQLLAGDITHLRNTWASSEPEHPKFRFETLSVGAQADLLQKTTVVLVTEQLVTLANQQTANQTASPVSDLWQNQQLADRLAAQMLGLQRLNQVALLGATVADHIDKSLAALSVISGLPPLTEKGLPTRVNWQDTYRALRDLVTALNAKEQGGNTVL